MESSEPEGTGNNVPAVLQLYSWGSRSTELPVSAFAKAAFSPSRELLLLQSRDREVILFPLGERISNAGGDITPNPLRSAPPPPSSGSPDLPPAVSSPIFQGIRSRSVSDTAEFASFRHGSSSAAVNPLLQTSPSTSYSNPPQTFKTSSPNSPHTSLYPPPSPSPSPSLGDVDCFAWASHGDGFGCKGPSGWFKELLFTSNEEGLYIHGFSPKSVAENATRSRPKPPDGLVGTEETDESTDVKGRWREGKWREWQAETTGVASESEFEVGKERNDSSSDRKEGDKRIVSYVVDAELEDSPEGLHLRFDGRNASWPPSADVVSFRFGAGSPFLSLLTSSNSRTASSSSNNNPISSAESSTTGPETKDSLTSEQPRAPAEDSADHDGSIEIVDIISNPSQTLIGIVTCQRSSTAEKSGLQEVSCGGDGGRGLGERNAVHEKKSKLGLMGNTIVSIALALEWGVKWIAAINLDEGTTANEGGTAPWASLVLTNDRLLGLKQDGGIFVWAASSGSLVAFIDLVRYCDLRPSSLLGAKKEIAHETEESGDLQQEKTKSIQTEAESSPHAFLNGESVESAEKETPFSGNFESSVESKESGGHHHRPKRHFTRLVATADSLLLAVTDEQGLLFVVSTDDYFVSQGHHYKSPSTNKKPYICTEDLKALSYWDGAGSDIGRALSTALLPNRRFLKSLDDETDIHGVHKSVPNTGLKISGGRENGPGPPVHTKNILQSATGFTSRMEVARRGPMNFNGSQIRPIRRVFLPFKSTETLIAVALSFNAITTMVRSIHDGEIFSITQNGLHILDGAIDERDFYGNMARKMEDRVQKRSNYIGDVLPFCSQGFLYLLTASSLHVVLPPLALSQSKSAPSQLNFHEERRYPGVSLETQNGNISFRGQGLLRHPWQTEVVDRALVCDGSEEAELLCLENGWSLQLLHLRRLQLAVDFVRTQDVQQALEALARVGAVESGVLCLLFAAVELMLNQHISDNELAQASKLLSSAASFTTRLVRQHGVTGWQSPYQQKSSHGSLESSRHKTAVTLSELARFLEVIRTLQVCLEEKRKGPNIKKGESGRDKAFVSFEDPNVKAPLEAIDEGVEETIAPYVVVEQGSGSKVKAMLSVTGVPSSNDSTALGSPSSSALVPTGSFSTGTGASWDISPTEVDGGKSRRRSHIESPGEMFSRWENENVDAADVVRDALKSSGRLALAVAQLQRMRMISARDNPPQEQGVESEDVFSELLRIGRGIVYELFCKGKTALAIAALRRLGEDIESALRDLALGTVGRFLHAQAVKELQRLMRLSTSDVQLFERVSLIEKEYASSNFWRTYEARRRQGVGASPSPALESNRNALSLVCEIFGEDGFKIECGEVDGVVLGSWSMIDDQPGVVEEELNLQDSNTSGYWAAAAVWLQPWDSKTVDKILLEPLLLQEGVVSWEAKLEFHVAHHNWQAVIHLLEEVPSSVQYEGMLHVHLDSDDTLSYDPSLPFSGVSDGLARGNLRNPWLGDGDTGEAVIPKVQILALDLSSVCNTSMWQIIEERLVRNHIFLKEHWKGTVELMALFSRAGLLFHPYSWGRNIRSKDLMFPGPTKGSKLHKDAVFGLHELVVQHCLRHSLPHFLELYLDFHSLALDKGYSTIMQYLVGHCKWALWLLYTGLQRRDYDASFANALTILAPTRNSKESVEDVNFLKTVDDMAIAGGEIMALATLMYAPVLLQKCLCTGHISSRHDRGSWQCTLESLQPGLQHFPTLWSTLVGACFGHDSWGFAYGRPLNPGSPGRLNQYLEWHQRLFSCARGDTSLLQMSPTWLPHRVRYLLQLTIRGPELNGGNIDLAVPTVGSMGSYEENSQLLETLVSAWEEGIQKTIEEELYAHNSEDLGWDCKHHLRRGHAVAAFSVLLNSRVQSSQDLKSGYGRLHSSEIQALFSPLTADEEKLIASVIPAVVMDYENSAVVAAFALFVELCGLSANLLRVDIAALRRISSYMKSLSHLSNNVVTVSGRRTTSAWDTLNEGGGDVTGSLAAELADDYVRAGVSALSSFSADRRNHDRRSGKSYSTIQQLLEKASLKDEGRKRAEDGSPGAWLFDGQGDGLLRTMQWSASESWSLVTAFCRAHGLPFSTTYLEILARDNDWVGFLAEAQLEGCPLDLLVTIVSKEFTNPRLQSQLLFVLKNLPGAASEKPAGVAAPEYNSFLSPNLEPLVSGMSANAELFSLLADCEGSKHPGKDLLRKAKKLRWPLLAVVASCSTDVTPQACLTTWLEITVVKEASVTEITDAATQSTLSGRIAAAVDATNAGAGTDSISGFRYNRTSSNKRQRLSSEDVVTEVDVVHAVPDGGNSDLTTDAQASQTDERAFPAGRPQGEGPSGAGDGGREQEESLASLVAILCEQQRFLPLLRAFELFTPTSSFLPFLRFLQAFSQMRISEASAHLASFTARLKEEMQQNSRSSSRSSNTTAWITRAAIAAADAMHGACPSAYERRCLLQLLSGSDFGDGGVAAMRYRRLYWKIQLAEPALQEGSGSDPVTDGANLDDKALFDTLEKSTQWEQARSWARQLDPVQSGSALHRVTETQAEAMVTEWKDFLWDVPEERVALWNHCQALFTMHAFPALKAGEFFLKHADALEPELSSSELHNILLVALQWLSGSITNCPPVYPLHLLHELETRVWLLAVESSVDDERAGSQDASSSLASMRSTPVGGLSHEISAASPMAMNFVDRTAATVSVVDSHLTRSSSNKYDGDEVARHWSQSPETSTSSSPTAKPTTSRFKRKQKEQQDQSRRVLAYSPEVAPSNLEEATRNEVQSEVVDQRDGAPEVQRPSSDKGLTGEEIVGRWEERVGDGEVDRAVLTLLEVGQVAAAKLLQQKLSPTNVPLEFSLVEAGLKVASLSPLTITGSAVSSAIPPDVVEHLQTAGLVEDVMRVSAIDMLEKLTTACREGCGKGLCQRISAIAKIADVLGLTFGDAFAKSPTQLLHLLALKGQDSLAEAKLLVATHPMLPASAARILAESFLKGLLAAHRGGYMQSSSQKEEGPAPLLWRPSDFIRWAQLCTSEPEIGHALMRLVISGRDMPHACEVELIILSYRYYERSACLDGVDVLVALAATRVDSYLAEGDYSSLARLVTGISNFQALHFIIDFLIENGQLELLLQKRSAVDAEQESSASIRGFRMAVLSALKHFNPDDLDAFAMVYSNFSMAHEMASLLESRGRRLPELWTSKQFDPEESEEFLDMMRFYVEAAKVYSGIDAGNKTTWCCAQASLISLQLRMPDHMWLNLSDTNARRLLVDQPRFQESLIVAEAYGLNQSAEWVPVIWNQMLIPGRIDQFLNDFVAALPLTHSMLMELARFYRAEVTARVDQNQLDFSKWLTPGGIPVELARHISKSFRALLKHTRDMKERLQLATVATGFPDVVELCLKNIDNMPVTSGPLILRRGHGGTYVPIM